MKACVPFVLVAAVLGSVSCQNETTPFRLMPLIPPGFFSGKLLFRNLCAMMIDGMAMDTPIHVLSQKDNEESHSFTVDGEHYVNCVKSVGGPDACRMSDLFDGEFFKCLEKGAKSSSEEEEANVENPSTGTSSEVGTTESSDSQSTESNATVDSENSETTTTAETTTEEASTTTPATESSS